MFIFSVGRPLMDTLRSSCNAAAATAGERTADRAIAEEIAKQYKHETERER
jgi:hypothetical protein